MNRAIAWFAKNSVAANLLMVLILGAGAVSLFQLKQEVFPEFSLDLVAVTVPYPGAAPEEVEEGINARIEDAIEGLDDIKRITSVANEGFGVVTVELELGADPARVLDDIKTRVDAIDTFPEEAEQPIFQEITNRRQVINVAVYGDLDLFRLRQEAERVRDELAALPEISLAELANAPRYEVAVEVSEQALRRYRLSFDDVVRAVRASSLDLPGGSIKTPAREFLLRAKGQAYTADEFARLPLLTRPDGTRLLLGDVARVRDAFEETDQQTRFDGHPAVMVQVFRTGSQSALTVAQQVKDYVASRASSLASGLTLATWQDMSKILRDRLSLLIRNGRTGLILVVLILALFLRLRLAGWVSLGIPISFLGAIWLMPWFDVSVNLISLFAFIVVLGIVVDDAIVVGENIYRHQTFSRDPLEGSIRGAQEVAVPVIFAVLTTVAAFVPLLMVGGVIGKIMRLIPIIVISTLVFSLIESMFILPAHLAHGPPPQRKARQNVLGRFQRRFALGVEWFTRQVYRRGLDVALEWRYVTLAVGLGTLILTVGLVRGEYIRFMFFPSVEADVISAHVRLTEGTPAEVTEAAVRRLEDAARVLERQLEAEGYAGVFRHMEAAVGELPYLRAQNRNAGGGGGRFSGSNLGEVTIELKPAEERSIGSQTLAERWRELTGLIPDAEEVSFSASLFDTGKDIDVMLTGSDLGELSAAADELKAQLSTLEGVYEIADSFEEGKPELRIRILPAGEIYGLRQDDLARQIRQAFYGAEAQRVQRGRNDVRVMVRYPLEERRSVGDLEHLRIRTPSGLEIPLPEVAEVRMGRGLSSITRVDGRRAVHVTASVDPERASTEDIVRTLEEETLPLLLARHPGLLYSFEGQRAEQRETMAGLAEGFALALLLIYVLLAVPLKSYVQPLIIMSAIPFGLVGAVWGHLIMGMDLTVLSMFGIVALSGVVVNDSLVMVDFVNRKRQDGAPLLKAVRESGVVRFRPILLTSLTTFGGLMPLILEKSMQARFLIPMAISLGFGVVFATFITLVLVPCGYIVLEDLRRLPRRWAGRAAAPAAVDRAARAGSSATRR